MPKICITPNGSPTRGAGVGHVHFHVFLLLISFALGSQREPSFQLKMDFPTLKILLLKISLGALSGARSALSAWRDNALSVK